MDENGKSPNQSGVSSATKNIRSETFDIEASPVSKLHPEASRFALISAVVKQNSDESISKNASDALDIDKDLNNTFNDNKTRSYMNDTANRDEKTPTNLDDAIENRSN